MYAVKAFKEDGDIGWNPFEREDFVHFAGPAYAGEKFDYLFSSHYFVHTSRWEGLSFSVIEALACGKPCLVTRPANPCGFIGPYHAGLEVDLSPSAIAKGFLQMSQLGVTQREKMESAALILVEKEFQWPEISQTVTDSYGF
jgi:glycosyltransferase involved in cell wall biosynthesis